MDKKLEQNRTPEVRITAKNLHEIYRLAEEKYGPDYGNMNLGKILEENPDWFKKLDLPANWRGIVVTSEESLKGIEAAAEIHATVESARRDFMDKTSGKKSGEKRDSVPPTN